MAAQGLFRRDQNMDSFLVICHILCSEEVSTPAKELGTK